MAIDRVAIVVPLLVPLLGRERLCVAELTLVMVVHDRDDVEDGGFLGHDSLLVLVAPANFLTVLLISVYRLLLCLESDGA